MATDSLMAEDGTLASLAPETMERLNAHLPSSWSHANPVDIIGDAPGSRYAEALAALLDDAGVDAVLVMHSPVAVADPTEAARAVVDTIANRRKPVLASWLGDYSVQDARRVLRGHGVATYDTPENATRAFMHIVRYQRNQELLLETPAAGPYAEVDREKAIALLDAACAEGRKWLDQRDCEALLGAYGIPFVPTRLAETAEQAAAFAAELDSAIAIKLLSPDLPHKTDVDGVRLNLGNPEAVRRETADMLDRVRRDHPDARIDGVMVQPMLSLANQRELIVGIKDDPLFGPAILFGDGGIDAEVIDDVVIGLPPLNDVLAREMIGRTRISRLLGSYRKVPAIDMHALVQVLIRLSQMAAELPHVAEMDINPLVANEEGVWALDTRIHIRPPTEEGDDARLAIHPYPRELISRIETRSGNSYLMRPVRPEDEGALLAFIHSLSPEDSRWRFLSPLKTISHRMAGHLVQLDYDREMALLALEDSGRIAGVVRLSSDPDCIRAEYAVVVRSDLKSSGLGYRLMQEMIRYAKNRGLQEVFGYVLRDNRNMLNMCREFGFELRGHSEDSSLMAVTLPLTAADK